MILRHSSTSARLYTSLRLTGPCGRRSTFVSAPDQMQSTLLNTALMQHVSHVVVIGLDVTHRCGDVRVVQQVFGDVDVPFRLFHQVSGQCVPEPVRCHTHAELPDQLLVHRLDLIGGHDSPPVVPRESVDVEQLIPRLESKTISFVQQPTDMRRKPVNNRDAELSVGLLSFPTDQD